MKNTHLFLRADYIDLLVEIVWDHTNLLLIRIVSNKQGEGITKELDLEIVLKKQGILGI